MKKCAGNGRENQTQEDRSVPALPVLLIPPPPAGWPRRASPPREQTHKTQHPGQRRDDKRRQGEWKNQEERGHQIRPPRRNRTNAGSAAARSTARIARERHGRISGGFGGGGGGWPEVGAKLAAHNLAAGDLLDLHRALCRHAKPTNAPMTDELL